ncbi:proline and serine-rich protein 3 isoform X1 [Rhineura floridana]|uniref:proline and serine-rich protein 3 isoform X1 n=1 Tax=Rhineura floridana TaxID=261503 RepID=UPI002AC7FFA8|nr:proline and serine-rich protein 3 isoform X1 [Rhineura floridana]XP_061453480.1 proline and serine-rich protein 3 isoform X1 [Rhineura floridana]XP_061453481.1 proline and serine-rich protein 3 isoform X1 [Rhineura floridana]
MDSKYDSCTAVFSTLGSPFLEASCSRSHYHPSQAQPLKAEQQYMVLSPSCLQHKSFSTSPKKVEALSPPSPTFLPDTSYQEVKPHKSDSTSSFNESWPSTERSSSSITPEGAKEFPSEPAPASPKPPDSVTDSESVIARYIERFRYGQPTNRRERGAPHGHSAEFWWLGHSFPPECNISKKEASPASDGSQSEVRQCLFSPALDQSPSGEFQDISTLDPETVSLQERASRLLLRSTSPLSSTRHVSSEGLNSTPTSTITNADTDAAGHAPSDLGVGVLQGSLGAFPCHTTQRSLSCSSKPENDILFQWRLRRKMEEASKAIAVMPNQIQPIYASSMVERTAWKSSEPACWRSRDGRVLPATETQLRVESALHECHPCCHTNFMKNGLTSPHHIETTPSTNGIVVAGSPEPKREQGVKGAAPPEGPVSAYPESSPPLRPAGTRNLLSQSTFHNVQQSAQPVKRVHAEPRGNQKAFRTKQGQAKPIGDHRELPASPIKHSIQHVLGEVVAERLFSPPESPGLHWDKQKRNSKNLSLEAALPSAVAAPSHSQLLNMAAQLLEQAEDSDGTEFEDDPLLQVLRAQRELLRSQLRAVDVRVVQLEGHHSDQDFSHR